MEKQFISKELSIVLFYVIYIGIAEWISTAFPSGPCNPGPGFLLYMLLIPIGVIYLFVHVYRYMKGESNYKKCIAVHLLVWLAIIMIVKYGIL